MRGKFLVIEGIDGCGKTTQASYLSKWLPHSGLMPKNSKLHLTREPGGTEIGKLLRKILLSNSIKTNPEPITELLLYAADRAQHISEFIEPALREGDWVLSDRFSGSTIAYQGFGRKLDLNLINQLEDIATQGIKPDITILLDLPVEKSIERRRQISNDRIEKEGLEFLTNVSLGFLELAKRRDWLQIPADSSPKVVEEKIKINILNILKESLY